jgi:gliding motility-associated-like protein
MFKSLWLKNRFKNNFKGSLGSLLFLFVFVGVSAQLPQKWYLGKGEVLDFTVEPFQIKKNGLNVDSLVYGNYKTNIFQVVDSLYFVQNQYLFSKKNNDFELNDFPILQKIDSTELFRLEMLDIIDSLLLMAHDSTLILYNLKNEKISTRKLSKKISQARFLKKSRYLQIFLAINENEIHILDGVNLNNDTIINVKNFLTGIDSIDYNGLKIVHTMKLNDSTLYFKMLSQSVNHSVLLSGSYNRQGFFELDVIGRPKTVKYLVEKDGSFAGYKTLGIEMAIRSPNDSITYTVEFEYEQVSHSRSYYTDHIPTGRIILKSYMTNTPLLNDSIVINGNWDFNPNNSDILNYNFQIAPNGNLLFIRNYDRVGAKGISYILEIEKPNDFSNINKKIIRKILLDTLSRYELGNQLPVCNLSYKKLRFLRAKQCTNELKLFADADSFFQKFEWHVANDTGGFDVFTGKNLRYPSKGKRTFYVKVKGIAKSGYFAWYSDTISFNTQPKAAFTVDTSQWCQWVGLQLQNTSVSEGAKSNSFTWQLLQNDTIKKTYSGKNPYLKFNANGSFDIRLIYNDGICVDTFTRKAAINIIPAPKPVFKVLDSAVCERDSVVVIDRAVGQVSEREFQWSDGFTTDQKRHARFFDSVGQFKITQTLTGPTGCVTKDSQWVRIRPGFTKKDSTEMLSASVLDSHLVLLKWKTNPNNMVYGIVRQQKAQNPRPISVWGHAQDSIIDTVPNSTRITQYQYYITLNDSCYNQSRPSNTAITMVLSRKNYNNQYAVLTWNAYEKWYGGVKEYVIESSENKRDWLPIDVSGQLTYPDYRLPQLQSDTVYYRIKAIEQNGNQQHSYSNVVKVPINTTLFIPNAFSPNGDGVNDIFKIGHFGLKEFECKIYSSTGQIVSYSTNPDEIWDGEFNELPYPIGNYRYVIKAIDQKGKELYYEGTLVLIR